MSTNDVPGFRAANNDVLACGCWAEHEDGSLIFVESTETNRVIYSIFDMAKKPPVEYRDAMTEAAFKRQFSWSPDDDDDDDEILSRTIWTWHDKTPFPWDRVIKAGATDGGRMAFAEHTLNAAERVAESLKLRGAAVARDIRHRSETTVRRSHTIWDKISRAVAELGR
jgi:hypothetical protein